MRHVLSLLMFVGLVSLLPVERSIAQQPRVELELIMERGFPAENAHDWMRALERVGADGMRIRAAQIGDGIGIKNIGTETSPRYKVYGMLTSNNRMMLQGGTFRMTDVEGIKGYLNTLRSEGLDGLFSEKLAFGLTATQLVSVHEDLGTPIRIDTKGQEVSFLIDRLERSLATPLRVDRSANTGLREGEPVLEELRGMTLGTGLAAMLRPLGLVLVPVKTGRDVELVIMDSRNAEEHWPVGWPLEDAPIQVAPDFFESLPVDIQNIDLQSALDAIQPRVGIPFVYDQNSMARYGIETDKVNVEAQGRLSYSRLVKRLLSQVRPGMKAELRTDEAGNPFLWITTVRE